MDFLSIISIIFLGFSVFFGFLGGKKIGWVLISLVPILGAGRLIVIPSKLVPLDFYQIGLSCTLGILIRMSLKRYHSIKPLVKDRLTKITLILTIIRIIVSEPERYPFEFFGWIPQIATGFILSYILVNNPRDLQKMLLILAIHGAIISFMVCLSYFADISIEEIFRSTIPNYNLERVLPSMRGVNIRVNGLDGNAVFTAARLIVLFPLCLYFYIYTKKKIALLLPILTAVGLVLLQTRASFVSLALAILYLLPNIMRISSNGWQIFSKLILSCFIFFLLSFGFTSIIDNFFPYLFKSLSSPFSMGSVAVKINRIPLALELILEHPLTGYGSLSYVYYHLMRTQDLPSFLMYALSGGIGFLTLYSLFLFYLPGKLIKLAIKKRENIIIFASAGVLAGCIMCLSNWIETHYMIMILIYVAIVKVHGADTKKHE